MISSSYVPDFEMLAYLRRNSLRETDVQRRLRKKTGTLELAGAEVAPEHAQFLQLLVQLMGARSILELGTFTGLSALSMALALPDDGELITCDMDGSFPDIGRAYWREAGIDHKIELRLGPAKDTLRSLLDEDRAGYFDLVFIDANKKDYDTYYEQALLLVRTGGLIALDNMCWGGRVLDPEDNQKSTVALRAIVTKLHGDERVTFSVVPIDDGLGLAVKR